MANRHNKMPPHGMRDNPAYMIWKGMNDRCRNENHANHHNYGGRGVKVCDRWLHSFPNFISDMGERPTPTHSIDRINGNGNYEPSNCRWATPTEQARNQRTNNISGMRGVLLCEKWSPRWNVTISVNRKKIQIGRFIDFFDAVCARKSAENKYWRES